MMPLSYVQGFSFADRSYRVMSVTILFTIEYDRNLLSMWAGQAWSGRIVGVCDCSNENVPLFRTNILPSSSEWLYMKAVPSSETSEHLIFYSFKYLKHDHRFEQKPPFKHDKLWCVTSYMIYFVPRLKMSLLLLLPVSLKYCVVGR